MLCRWWALLMLGPAIAAASAPVQTPGERWWGVVVGVGEYERLDASLSLEGPPNDVPLVLTWLRRQGVPRRHLTVLADHVPGVDGLPTRAAILDALAALPGRMQSGDIAFLYLAGHGSQQPQGGREWSKADGLDEIFLPRDVGRWDAVSGRVQGAIVDYEIGSAIEALRARGIFVWLVVDSCHSATLARALLVPHVRVRAVSPQQLGAPPETTSAARTSSASAQRLVKAQGLAVPGGYVAFYAAQTTESAPELPLPAGEPGRQVHGLFTYAMLKALDANGRGSYREVAHRILAYYDSIYPATTPEFEGQMDGPIGAPSAPLLAPGVWPAEHDGKNFRIESGRLNGVEPQSLLALYPAIPAAGPEQPIGLLRVNRATLTDAWAQAISDPAELKAWHVRADHSADVASGIVRVLRTQVDTLVRVAGPASCFASLPAPYDCGSASVETAAAAQVARARLMVSQADSLPRGVELTSDVDAADLYLLVRGHQVLVLRSATSPADEALGLDLDSQAASRDLKQILYQANRSIAFSRLAPDFPDQPGALLAEVRMRSAAGRWSSLDGHRSMPIPFNAELSIQLQNTGPDDLDVTILALDDHFGIVPVYPPDRESNLLRKGSARIVTSVWARPSGENELVFIVEKARSGQAHDLSYLAQPGVTRGVDGEGLGGLLERIGFSPRGTRAGVPGEDLQSASIRVLRYEVSAGT
jgi:Caspase domain